MRVFKSFAILCTLCSCFGGIARAQTVETAGVLTTVYNFCADVACVDGSFQYNNGAAAMAQGTNGDLYGTTWGGGAYGYGTVFGITPSGTLATLYSFCANADCPDGSGPYFGLVLATDGDLYGITTAGGAFGAGTVFKITPSGKLITLHSFCAEYECADGSDPWSGLIQATNGDLYGATRGGGGVAGNGTIFKITKSGTLTTLHIFNGSSDGGAPQAPLVQATNGDLYGTTYNGGAGGYGTIFKITLNGELITLHNFNGTDGNASQAALVQATDGYLYGTNKFSNTYNGTIYKITPTGTLTTLYAFDGTDGQWPNSALIQATDGNLYGTTEIGGTSGTGTIFEITPSGTLTTLYDFGSNYGGGVNGLYGGLVQATNGDLYGATERGGTVGDGTVFSFNVGLTPFVETLPRSGKVGADIRILGSQLEQATSVTFNGTAAAFKVVSGTEIRAAVPAGATTGTVVVTQPNGVLSSNKPFTVRE
jgi:uncharacterized repeat protein (TIGR03803 family)